MKWTLLLWIVSLSASAQQTPIEQRLSANEEKLEQLYADYWRLDHKNALGDREASTIPVQQQIRALVTDPEFLKDLGAADFKDPLLQRRRKLFLEEAVHTNIYTDPRLAKLVEDMGNDEAAIVYEVDSRRFKRSELNNFIAQEPDREKRRQAWLARAKNHEVVAARIQQAMKLRKELAQKYAKADYVDFMLERKGAPDRKRLLEMFERFRAATEPEYQSLLQRMREKLKVTKVEPWDIEFFFSTLAGDFEERKFPRDGAWPKIKRLSKRLGFDFDTLPVQTTIAAITFGGATYPILYGREVRILINKYDGIRFTDTLLHEAGHALHYALMEDPTFILRGTSSEPFDEGCGQIMALMLYRSDIAQRFFGLTPKEHAAIAKRYRLRTLVDMRDTIAEAKFEYAAYAGPDQDLAALYNKIYAEQTGLDLHGAAVWAFTPFFATGPVYVQSYAVAEMAARQVHADMEHRFGPSGWGRLAGNYLHRNYFSISGRMTLDEVLEHGTGEPLNPDYLVGYALGKRPKRKVRCGGAAIAGRPGIGCSW